MRKAGQVLLLTVALTAPAQPQEHDNFDVRLFRVINGQQNPEQDGFFEYLDESSIPTFGVIPGGFFLVGAFEGDRRTGNTGVLSFCSQITTLGVTVGLKWAIDRPRPFQSLEEVKVKHRSSASGSSFPSGHTSQAFAIATIISLSYSKPAVTIPLFLWAGLIGYGRVYLGVHYPTDVLGGIAVGIGSSLLFWSIRHTVYKATEIIFPPENMSVPTRIGEASVPRVELVRFALPLN